MRYVLRPDECSNLLCTMAENGRQDGRQGAARAGDRAPTGRRLTVQDAAAELGITVEAVRSRLKRGTLKREKGEDGTAYVLVEDRPGGDRTQPGGDRASDGADARARQDGDRAPLLYEHMASEITIYANSSKRSGRPAARFGE